MFAHSAQTMCVFCADVLFPSPPREALQTKPINQYSSHHSRSHYHHFKSNKLHFIRLKPATFQKAKTNYIFACVIVRFLPCVSSLSKRSLHLTTAAYPDPSLGAKKEQATVTACRQLLAETHPLFPRYFRILRLSVCGIVFGALSKRTQEGISF